MFLPDAQNKKESPEFPLFVKLDWQNPMFLENSNFCLDAILFIEKELFGIAIFENNEIKSEQFI